MEANRTLGFDIGGTTIKGGLVDSEGRIERKIEFPTPRDPWDLVDQIILALEDLGGTYPLGLSCAGTVDSQEMRITDLGGNIENWKGFDVGAAFRDKGVSLHALENDANCALKAELVAGAGQGQAPVLMVTLGTGVGGALSIDGRTLYHGGNYAALEIGHIILDPKGPLCSCGQRGCAETFLSARAFYQAMVKEGYKEAQDFFLQEDHPFIRAYWEAMTSYIVSLENTLNPRLLIIGGGFVNYAPNFVEDLARKVEEKKNGASKTRILKASFDNEAGLIGAAFLAREVAYE